MNIPTLSLSTRVFKLAPKRPNKSCKWSWPFKISRPKTIHKTSKFTFIFSLFFCWFICILFSLLMRVYLFAKVVRKHNFNFNVNGGRGVKSS